MSAQARPAAIIALLLIGVPFALRLALVERRGFNPDELEHTHLAWCISKGQVPYRDYFEHHTPLLHYTLAALLARQPVDTDPDAAVAALFQERRLMWAFTALGLALTLVLARRRGSAPAAWAATLLLADAPFFLAKSLEVRPDVPAFALLVGGVALAIRGFDRVSTRACFGSGLLLGTATMVTQKALFAAPGLAVASAMAILAEPRGPSRTHAGRGLAVLILGAAVPVLATAGFFASQGALWAFVNDNFLLNASWPGLGPGAFLLEWLRQDPLFIGFGIAGLGVDLLRLREPSARRGGAACVALTTASLLAGFAVLPAVTFHYFLLLLPFMAVHAGAALVAAFEGLAALGRVARVALALAFAALAWGLPLALDAALPRPGAWAIAAFVLVALLMAASAARGAQALVALALIAVSLQPLARFQAAFSRGNWGTVQGIRYVLRNSAPWEPCLDGFTGLGVFRPHAFFHPFQHWHTWAIQSGAEHRAMIESLRSGQVLPKLVFWNHYLEEGVDAEMKEFLLRHYVPTGLEPIRVRPFDSGLGFWQDEAPRFFGWVRGQERGPHTLFDDKWRIPGSEDGVAVRRSRTARSGFILPIQRPRDFHLVLHARADAGALPFDVELVVNGRSLGSQPAAAGFTDYTFDVNAAALIPGFNACELRFETRAAPTDRRLELAVAYLQLTRAR